MQRFAVVWMSCWSGIEMRRVGAELVERRGEGDDLAGQFAALASQGCDGKV